MSEIHEIISRQFDEMELDQLKENEKRLKYQLEWRKAHTMTLMLRAVAKYVQASQHGKTDYTVRIKGIAQGYLYECREQGYMTEQQYNTFTKLIA